MQCDPVTMVCKINMGALVLVVFLAVAGISITLFGAAEDVQAWWGSVDTTKTIQSWKDSNAAKSIQIWWNKHKS